MDLHFSNEAMRDLNYLHISLNSENITRLRQRRQKVKKGRMGHHRCIMHHPATYGPGYAQNTGDRRLDLSSSLSVSHHSTMYTVHGTGDCNQDFKVSRCPCTSTSTLPTLWPGAHTKNRPQSLSDKHIYLRNDYCSVMPVSRIELAGWHRCYVNHLEAHHGPLQYSHKSRSCGSIWVLGLAVPQSGRGGVKAGLERYLCPVSLTESVEL